MALAAVLAACQTTNTYHPVSYNSHDIAKEKLRRDIFVNVTDPHLCKDEVSPETGDSKSIHVDRKFLCLVARDMSDNQAKIIADISEIAYQKVASFLKIENPRKITVIVREEAENMPPRALAPKGRVYIPLKFVKKGFIEGALIHEFSHALMGASGPYFLRIERDYSRNKMTRIYTTSSLLNEGIAQYLQLQLVEADDILKKKMNLHAIVKSRQTRNIRFYYLENIHTSHEWNNAHGSVFSQKKKLDYYVSAGSFTKFLIEKKGLKNFLKMYRGGEFESIYGMTLVELQADWLTFIENGNDFHLFPNGLYGPYDTEKLSDKLICRHRNRKQRFAEEYRRRKLDDNRCIAQRNLFISPHSQTTSIRTINKSGEIVDVEIPDISNDKFVKLPQLSDHQICRKMNIDALYTKEAERRGLNSHNCAIAKKN